MFYHCLLALLFTQSSVKSYLSQRFRNQRRSSEPLQAKGKTSKLITSAHATPVAASLKPQDTEGADDDPVAYERNNAALVAEVKRPQPRINTMKRLLELTCKGRRGIINSSTSKTTELLEQFPFFKDKRMVCSIHVKIQTLDHYTGMFMYSHS